MNAFLKWGGCGLVAAIAWHVGGMIDRETVQLALGVLFGIFAGIPAALIVATRPQQRRVDVYHHPATETPREPQKQPAAALPARPTQYIVVDEPQRLQPVQQPRIEVSR